MSPLLGWGLALLALGVGNSNSSYGWRGILLALTAVVFWPLLQFSRTLGLTRKAGARPLGYIDSAVMLQTKLQRGTRMLRVVTLTQSLGRKIADAPESFVWRDAGGDELQIELRAGRVSGWQLVRAPPVQ